MKVTALSFTFHLLQLCRISRGVNVGGSNCLCHHTHTHTHTHEYNGSMCVCPGCPCALVTSSVRNAPLVDTPLAFAFVVAQIIANHRQRCITVGRVTCDSRRTVLVLHKILPLFDMWRLSVDT
jgi:hypothetical protein